MAISRVFQGTLQPSLYSLSDLIGNAVAFYIVAPDIVDEVQIDVYLQLEVTPTENRQILLFESRNEVDTEILVPIPYEYINCNLSKRFALYCDFTVNIELYCAYIDGDINTETINTILSELRQLAFSETLANAALVSNQIAQNTALSLLGVSLSPITLGTSLAVEPPLLTGTSILTQLLLP